MKKRSLVQITPEYHIKLELGTDNSVLITAHGPGDWERLVWAAPFCGTDSGRKWKFKHTQRGILKGTKFIAERISTVEQFEESSKVLETLSELRV